MNDFASLMNEALDPHVLLFRYCEIILHCFHAGGFHAVQEACSLVERSGTSPMSETVPSLVWTPILACSSRLSMSMVMWSLIRAVMAPSSCADVRPAGRGATSRRFVTPSRQKSPWRYLPTFGWPPRNRPCHGTKPVLVSSLLESASPSPWGRQREPSWFLRSTRSP